MNNWSIKARVLFVVLVPLTITILVLSANNTWSRLKSLNTEFHDRGQAIADQMAPSAEYGIFSGNKTALDKLGAAIISEPDVKRVNVYDSNGDILSSIHAPQGKAGASATANQDTELKSFSAPVYASKTIIDDYQSGVENKRLMPATHAARAVGHVEITLSKERMHEGQRQVIDETIIITFGALIIATLLSLKLAASVAKPIHTLVRTVIAIKNGDLDARADGNPGGELGILEKGINSMAQTLAEARNMERKQAEDALYIEKTRAQITLQSIGEGVITTDSYGIVTYINPVAEQMTGWKRSSATGQPLNKIFTIYDASKKKPLDYPLFRCVRDGETVRHESNVYLMRQEGSEFSIQDVASPIRDRNGIVVGAVIIFHDYTEIHNMAELLEYQATHDDLTGLLNRREFERLLENILDNKNISTKKENILFYLDLDQFKLVNDTCGHIAGDNLLKEISQTIHSRIRLDDVFARLGGDEFGLILTNCSLEKGIEIAESIRASIKGFIFQWEENMFEVGVSIGAVPLRAGQGSLTEVLSAADSACYIAKDKGRNRIHIYQQDDEELAKRQGEMEWVNRLHKALAENRFHLYAQPIIAINSLEAHSQNDKPSHYEILLRMAGEDGRIIGPSAFIPPAERYQVMSQLDRWVIHATFDFIYENLRSKNISTADMPHFNINLSGQSVCDENFLHHVISQFERTGIIPSTITFEITETAAIANLAHAIQFIDTMKERGCLFALDDFGSGLSSFRYLSILPVDYIKIDGYFVRDIETNAFNRAMVEAVNSIGHVLGIKTIAEFVESQGIQSVLHTCGVDMVQGFHLGRPLPLHQAIAR